MSFEKDLAYAKCVYNLYTKLKQEWPLDQYCYRTMLEKEKFGQQEMRYRHRKEKQLVFYLETKKLPEDETYCYNNFDLKVDLNYDSTLEFNKNFIDSTGFSVDTTWDVKLHDTTGVLTQEGYFQKSLLHSEDVMLTFVVVEYLKKRRCSPFYINLQYFKDELKTATRGL